MTETKLKQVCDEAVEIQREIAALEKRADKIRLLIIAEATTSDAKKPTDGGGESSEFAARDSSRSRHRHSSRASIPRHPLARRS
jgi:hypothetical protein